MNRKLLVGTMVAALMAATSSSPAGELSADITAESRAFPTRSPYESVARFSGAISLRAEYDHQWNRGRDILVLSPYLRIDMDDDKRSLVDIHEFYWQKRFGAWDFSLGYRRVFWGVTESVHLVDIVNQTDLAGSIDGEEKLGQPMVQLTWIGPWGIAEAYWMPIFRERTFPGRDGRLRPSIVIDASAARYDSPAERWHQDWALRWFHTRGSVDVGLSYFSGTERDPTLEPRLNANGEIELIPRYRQTKRLGVDLLWVHGGWLWKFEGLSRVARSERNVAMVAGFEYTLVGIASTRYDLGLLAEYLYDKRGSLATPFENDIFVGSRLALNDVSGTSILVGLIVDLDRQSRLGVIEAGTRLSDWWSLDAELRVFSGFQPGEQIFDLRHDDFVRLRLTRHL